ncbi:hypothetical protein H0H92_015498, partial [Tricholoma furcatifolium]
MLKMVVMYRAAVDTITGEKTLNLRRYELFDEDWKVIDDLVMVLEVYKEATLFFSIDNKASIANVIPTMDKIDKMLREDAAKTTLTPAVREALGFARRRLDKYYSKTDTSNIYRIAMVLHPKLKTRYFQQNSWTKGWVDMALEVVREEWVKYKSSNTEAT